MSSSSIPSDPNQWSLSQLNLSNLRSLVLGYDPLVESQEEIRLLNVFKQDSDTDLVRCSLATVSLKANTAEYQDFLSRYVPVHQKKRETMETWTRRHNPSTSTQTTDANYMINYIPSKENYRFTWGDYAALSYVWGEPGLTHQIIVNDQVVRVGRNLEIALRALSAWSDFEDGFRVWVDAICINQDDFEERGRQVNKMRDIYGGAWRVIAWLGEERDNSDQALTLVQTLADLKPEFGEELAERLAEDPELLGRGSWTALHDLMNRPYWYRLWIIQELVLGSSALVLRCGDSFMDWTSFCRGIGFLFDYLWTVKDELLFYELEKSDPSRTRGRQWLTTSLHLVHTDLWSLSHYEEQGRAHLRFDRLLNVANSAQSRDPRDKIYGLVGLMDPTIAVQILPNYHSSLAMVHAAVAKLFILTYGNLEPLREGNPWSYTNTPSWAADWGWNGRLRHKSPEKNDLMGPFWTKKGIPKFVEAAQPYRASGDTAPEISFSNNDLHLTCRGFIVDRIAGLSARGKGYFGWEETSIIQPERMNNMYSTIKGVSEALYRTLVADRVAGGIKASERHAAILNLPSTFSHGWRQFQKFGWSCLASQEGYYFRWELWREANQNFNLMGRPLHSYFSDKIPDDASEYDYTEVYACFDRTCKGRRFMTTERGYMGWAPDNILGSDEAQTKKGDLIAILFGCSTPLVIRPLGDCFQVVGEAYVQRLMDGEALQLLDTKRFFVENFTFC